MARKPRLSTRLAGAPQPAKVPSGSAKAFGNVYGRPQRIKADLASGALKAGPALGQARAKRRTLAQSLLKPPGAQKGLLKAFGPNYEQGDLSDALKTVHDAAGASTSSMSPELTQAKQKVKRLLGIRKSYLQRQYVK